MDRIERVVRQVVDERRVAEVVAALDGRLVERIDGVFDALLFLALGVDRVERALRDVGGASGEAAFLDDNDLRSFLGCRYRCSESRAAAADNAYVGGVRIGDLLFGRRARFEGFERACLFGAILDALLQAHAREGGAGDRIEGERLVLHHVRSQVFECVGTHAERFLVRTGIDRRDGGVGERHVDGERCVVADYVGAIRSGLPGRCSLLLGFRRASGQSESHQSPVYAEHGGALHERPSAYTPWHHLPPFAR